MAFLTTWSTITSAMTDADSPLDVTLMEGVRQNLIHVYEWIGQGYTPSTAHNHNGVNSASVILGINSVGSSAIIANSVTSTKIGSTAVELGHLKMTRGSYSKADAGSGTDIIFYTNYNVHLPILFNNAALPTQARLSCITDGSGASSAIRGQFELIWNNANVIVYWDYHSS